MKTNEKIPFGKYKNQMWNKVKELDPAYAKWALNTKPEAQFSHNFLEAAKIELMDAQESHYWDNRYFNP